MKAALTIAVLTSLLSAGSLSGSTSQRGQPVRWTPAELSSRHFESHPAFSPDGREMFFVRSVAQPRNYRIMWTRCGPQGWSDPVEAPFSAAPGIDDADPFMTRDGKRLYFISTRATFAQTGNDDWDIWHSDRQPDGSWGEPVRMPEPVNSRTADIYPRLATNGLLYFSSEREGSRGLADIWTAEKGKDGAWKIVNLGSPVNTAEAEWEAEISPDGKTLIVAADRSGPAHLELFQRQGSTWTHVGRIPASNDVFQYGMLMSPHGDRVLFAQRDGERSGEIFLSDLTSSPDKSWPPRCDPAAKVTP